MGHVVAITAQTLAGKNLYNSYDYAAIYHASCFLRVLEIAGEKVPEPFLIRFLSSSKRLPEKCETVHPQFAHSVGKQNSRLAGSWDTQFEGVTFRLHVVEYAVRRRNPKFGDYDDRDIASVDQDGIYYDSNDRPLDPQPYDDPTGHWQYYMGNFDLHNYAAVLEVVERIPDQPASDKTKNDL